MADLLSKSPAHGLLPASHGTVTLTESLADITSVAAFNGKGTAVNTALKSVGAGWPKPNRALGKDTVALWSGRGQAMVLGPCPELADLAATTDQSDAWCILTLEGADIEDVLARVTPLDINASVFKTGHTARSLLGHINALFWRQGKTKVTVLVFRSMAHTAVQELTHAMRSVAARKAISA